MTFKDYYVYILSSRPNGAIYIGVTNDLKGRVIDHRDGVGSKHTARYKIDRLVYYEMFTDINLAIAREKTLKKWDRPWKDDLINAFNPSWRDMFGEI